MVNMRVFSEVYLDEVVETQGRLFDKIVIYFPEIDTTDFIEKYTTSNVRRYIDEGQAYLCNMNEDDLWKTFVEQEYFVPKKGRTIK